MGLYIVKGNILDLNYDAIVVPSTTSLDLTGAIGGQVKKICGEPLQTELRQYKKMMQISDAVIANAYNMNCKRLILVADPKWHGGDDHEEDNLANSYINALDLADAFKLNSVAFPILATGNYKFPKKRAIEIAINTIKSFLKDCDLNVALVVYDTDTFTKYYKYFSKFTIVEGDLVDGEKVHIFEDEMMNRNSWYNKMARDILEKGTKGASFVDILEYFRVKHGKTHTDVYTNAISKAMYNKITKLGSIPKRNTAIALAINLELDLEETLELLAPLKYTLNETYEDDQIIISGIDRGQYIDEINKQLLRYKFAPLTAKEN